MTPRRLDAERQFAAVREQLVKRRRALGLSMSALAREIGVTPSMISQIERGQSLPSVETLFALASALEVGVDSFFGPVESAGEAAPESDAVNPRAEARPRSLETTGALFAGHPYVVRKGDRASIRIEGGIRWELLTPEIRPDVEFLELVYEPGARSSEHLYPHEGYEMVVVLEGSFDVEVGFERYTLNPGDSIAFDSSRPHRYVNPLPQESRAVTLILQRLPEPLGNGDSHR